MAVRKVVTNAVQRDAESVRTHHHGTRHASEGNNRSFRRWVSRGPVIQQESDCGGAIVVGIEAVYVYAMPEYVRHAVVEVHNARNVSRLVVCQAAEEGAEAAIGDRRPSVVAANAHPVFGAPSDELLLIFCGATRKQGVDNSVAHSMT